MVKYDEDIINEFAGRLYSRASSVVAVCTVVGLLLGGVGGSFAGFGLTGRFAMETMIAAAACAVLGAGIGFVVGRERAFALKLQAQTALCQVAIAQNTKGKAV